MEQAARQKPAQWWDSLLTTIQVETPVLSVDLMMNRWLLYQSLSCRIWGRSALYQSSGAYGFRDQLQDSLAFVYLLRRYCARDDSARRIAAVRRRRRAALVASAFRSGCSHPMFGRSAVASVRGRANTSRSPATSVFWTRRTTFLEGPQLKDGRARSLLSAGGLVGAGDAVRALPPGD